ncbi:type VI secretion protein IcmF [Yersinia enterocolitica]|uniref:type VI secretion protein IcmF/TssM N-terminal domain-containing protein n=1 Tax=Yersinia mollaretii TaxID=33060 RepID=UPI0005DEAE6D|nr:type VI secretion protein IcmF/TssM N-terminal domain-containing protein [Yersinia mollaretii]CNK96966.1 type VI secretion protein IcmF [Yersinia enterocolitica]
MFKKLICFTGWLLILSLSLVFCFTLGLWQNWSTPAILLSWLALLLTAALLWGLIFTFTRAIKEKQVRRWFEKYRLSRREYVLLSHWKRGASIIKRINRQRVKLPWYLLVGERCGKSTLLASAGLPRFDGNNDDAVPGPTRTLHWWFFRQLCILDLSSNFLNGAATFRGAWVRLTQWCTRMPPPAGIIVALPVSALMNDDLSALHSLARQQRSLIEPLVRRFGERLPLHIMVTQCDQFSGFSLWHKQLSAAQRQQPLGYSWPISPHIDSQDELAIQPLFAALKRGMSRVRFSMARPTTLSAQDNATLLDFPEAFATLEPKLRYVLASLCEPNAYFSHVHLSSVWFTATEPQADNHGRRVSVFVDDLLTGHLRDLSLRRGSQRWYNRPRGRIACHVGLVVCALWFLFSAATCFGRLAPNIPGLSPDALAAFLMQDEQYSASSLLYLPFRPLLEKQHKHAESLLTHVSSTPRLAQKTLIEFQQQVLAMKPAQQREHILQLAHAVLIWQQMRDGATLEKLHQDVPLDPVLWQRNYPDTLSPLAVIALERHAIQQPEGERWLQTARQVLATLVNHDPALNWLTVSSSTLPSLRASLYWPSLPESVALPGIWTHAGEASLNGWMSLIERAIGTPQHVFQEARKHNLYQRQNAWKQFLIEVTASLTSLPHTALTPEQLIALGQNESQAMKFADRTLDELKDIQPEQAQSWLSTLRNLQRLAVNGHTSALLSRATQVDIRLRQSLTAWLRGNTPKPRTDSALPASLAWRQWQNARNSAVTEAVAQEKPDVHLTHGLFGPSVNSGDRNPLTGLLPALTTLQEELSPQNNDASIAAVWHLYQDDARRLLGNALSQSACWLNNQWKSTVLWPLDKDSGQRDYDEQQAQSQQSITAFLRGPAKMLLTNSANGPEAADYAGIRVPLSDSFIRLARDAMSPEMMQDLPQRTSTRMSDRRAALVVKHDALSLKLSEVEKKSWKTSVASLPATVPGGAKVIPIGTELTLNCQKGDQQLTSMNFAEKRDFNWQPGQCDGMTLRVKFPDFNADYQLNGDDAWPGFINRLTDGNVLLDSNDFGDKAGLLKQLGIKQILVRFAVSNPQEMESAWQIWSDITDNIRDLDAQISSLDEHVESQPLNPISALPDTIAQCQ